MYRNGNAILLIEVCQIMGRESSHQTSSYSYMSDETQHYRRKSSFFAFSLVNGYAFVEYTMMKFINLFEY